MASFMKQYWLPPLLFVAGLDAVFKVLALRHLSEFAEKPFLLGILLHKNPGIAFNIDIGFSLTLVASFLIIAFLLYETDKYWNRAPERAFATLTIAIGALGNLVDRASNGFTTDYLFAFNAILNLSDLLVLLGVFLFLRYTKHTTG
jgi:lipoprotein signal peptidase